MADPAEVLHEYITLELANSDPFEGMDDPPNLLDRRQAKRGKPYEGHADVEDDAGRTRTFLIVVQEVY